MKMIAKILVIWAAPLLMSTVLASHGSLRSCYECAKQAKNYMCNWKDNKDGLVACCEPGSKALYCQPSENNKCSPSFEVSKGMFFTNCPGIDKDLCKTDRKNLTLKATTKR